MRLNEELAVLTALQKMVKKRLDEVRAEADADLRTAFDDDGVTKRALKLGGMRVGDHIVVLSSSQWEVEDRAAFEDFALTYGFADVAKAIKPECMAAAIGILEREMPEAIAETVKVDPKWEDYVENVAGTPMFMDSGMTVPGVRFTGQKYKNTQVRGCNPEMVAPILQQLGGVETLLLGEPNKQLTTPKEGHDETL